jgi:hypothetical protein
VSGDPKSLLRRERSETAAALSVRTKSESELASLRGISFRRSRNNVLDFDEFSVFEFFFLLVVVTVVLLLAATTGADFTKIVARLGFCLDGEGDETTGLVEVARVELDLIEVDDLDGLALLKFAFIAANLGELNICLSRSLPLFDLDLEIIERTTSSLRISCQPGTESSLAIDPSCFAVYIFSSAEVAMLYSQFCFQNVKNLIIQTAKTKIITTKPMRKQIIHLAVSL